MVLSVSHSIFIVICELSLIHCLHTAYVLLDNFVCVLCYRAPFTSFVRPRIQFISWGINLSPCNFSLNVLWYRSDFLLCCWYRHQTKINCILSIFRSRTIFTHTSEGHFQFETSFSVAILLDGINCISFLRVSLGSSGDH